MLQFPGALDTTNLTGNQTLITDLPIESDTVRAVAMFGNVIQDKKQEYDPIDLKELEEMNLTFKKLSYFLILFSPCTVKNDILVSLQVFVIVNLD